MERCRESGKVLFATRNLSFITHLYVYELYSPTIYFSYAISAMLRPEESEHSSWQEASEHPMAEHLILAIEEKTNSSLTFEIYNNEINRTGK
jgi:hypothetical protein